MCVGSWRQVWLGRGRGEIWPSNGGLPSKGSKHPRLNRRSVAGSSGEKTKPSPVLSRFRGPLAQAKVERPCPSALIFEFYKALRTRRARCFVGPVFLLSAEGILGPKTRAKGPFANGGMAGCRTIQSRPSLSTGGARAPGPAFLSRLAACLRALPSAFRGV